MQKCLHPLAKGLIALRISANQVSSLCIILACLAGGLLYLYPLAPWALCFWSSMLLLRLLFNILDGMIARMTKTSRLGHLLNEVGDSVMDVAFYLPLISLPGVNPQLLMVFLCLLLIGEVAGLTGLAVCQKRVHVGPMGKPDRALLFALFGFLMAANLFKSTWLNGALLVVGILLLITIINRCYYIICKG